MKYKNMSNQKPKELYLGQRIEDLDEMYSVPDLREKKPKMLCASAQKMFERAEKAYEEGNEEFAYISYMKYLRVVTILSKDPDYIKDKKYYNAILGVSNPDKAITIAERLKLRLTERYKENDRNKIIQDIEDQKNIKQKIEEDRKKAAEKKSTHYTKPVISKGMPDSDDVTITSQQLFTLLKERSHKIMILDIRPAKDFCESHITHRYCINVPEDIIAAGHTANVLEQNLPMESKKVWAERQSMDLIVLLDWSSTAVIPGKPLHVLKTILLRWDVKVHYKRSPVALERGYEDFLLRYPSMSTNAHVTTPSTNSSLDDVLSAIDYPNSIDDVWTNEQMSLPTDRQTYISTARPMYVPGNPSIDRSSKAAAIQTYTERARSMQYILDQQEKLVDSSLDVEKQRIKAEKDWEHVRSKTEKEERSEVEQSDHQLREQEILSLLMQLENKQHDMELENQDLRNKLDVYRQKELEEAERIAEERDDEISSSGDTPSPIKESSEMSDKKNIIVRRHLEEKEERIREVERQRDELDRRRETMESERKRRLAHARKNKKPTQPDNEDYDGYTTPNDGDGTGINRSHSSPNIAQMEDDDEGTIPQFDRTTKPHKSTISSELPPVRQRDFQPVWGRVGRGLTGLKNLGNTCYMNSIIQCLNNTCALAAYLCTGEYRSHVNRGQPTRGLIADELAAVLRALCSGQYRFIAIKDLRSVVGKHQSLFRGVEQQDSHEFLTILMDWLHDDLQFPIKQQEREGLAASERAWQEYTKCRESLVLRLFYGQMRSTVRCSVCGEESITYDSFSNLSLELPPNANRCSLGDCLKLYLNGEKIIGWNCPSCKDKRDATKKLDISRLPPVLVIHFKRFYVDPKDYMSNTYRKKQTYIDFPLENLDMRHFSLHSPHLAQRSLYNLYGVSNHYGSMEGGHYTAYCKSTNYGKWYKFDDHVVSEITPSDVKSSAAYILFYTSQVEVP